MTGRRSTPQRTPVLLDPVTGRLRMGDAERRVDDPADREQVYGAYLSLLYAVRGTRRGNQLPLRTADLDALLAIVGDDPDRIEQRLVELMGCSAEEASLLRRVLLRHRALTASVGVAAGISAFALAGPSAAGSVLTPAPEPAYSVPAETVEQPPLDTYATTDDGRHVAPPEDWEPLPDDPSPAEAEEPAAPVRAAAVPPAAAQTTTGPATPVRTAPAEAVTPAPPPVSDPVPADPTVRTEAEPADADVVVGEPTAPIDRPGSWIAEPTGREHEVVLGEPMAPIDRPGSWIAEPTGRESEVVLGEPTGPIDREGSWIHPPGTGDGDVVLG